MPQINKGGKFIFGKSLINKNGVINLPPQAVSEYKIASEGRVYLFSGSKSTGGFCVTRKGLLLPSKLGHILIERPSLLNYTLKEGKLIPYKNRYYCWVSINTRGSLALSRDTLTSLKLTEGMELLSIRSSDIAFTMGAFGPLLTRAENYQGIIPLY